MPPQLVNVLDISCADDIFALNHPIPSLRAMHDQITDMLYLGDIILSEEDFDRYQTVADRLECAIVDYELSELTRHRQPLSAFAGRPPQDEGDRSVERMPLPR